MHTFLAVSHTFVFPRVHLDALFRRFDLAEEKNGGAVCP